MIQDVKILHVLYPSNGKLNECGDPLRPTNARRLGNLLRKCGFNDVSAHGLFHAAGAYATSKSGVKYYFFTSDDRCFTDRAWGDPYLTMQATDDRKENEEITTEVQLMLIARR